MKPILILLLLSCTKQTTYCERWEVALYEKKEAICPTGRYDTVSVCFNSRVHEDMSEVFERVDSVVFRMYKKKI